MVSPDNSVEIQNRSAAIEWPTVALIFLTYAVLALLIWHHAALPWWLVLPIGAYFAALQSSLQHEVLHGHPTRSRIINEALVFIAPHFWLPYGRYRDTHLAHHNDANLTCPVRDPESYYMLPQHWAELAGIKRSLYWINQTLAGRMILGPAISIVQFWAAEWKAIFGGDTSRLGSWLAFAVSSAILIFYIDFVCGMPMWKYVLLIAYPGISLALVRSFCEHQAAEAVGERTIIVEASVFWSLLFLNNNLHLAHHSRPSLAWYKLPQYYANERKTLISKNNGYVMRGYGEIFRRYFLRAKEPVAHPNVNWLAH
jgi:fatty acid desaturase